MKRNLRRQFARSKNVFPNLGTWQNDAVESSDSNPKLFGNRS